MSCTKCGAQATEAASGATEAPVTTGTASSVPSGTQASQNVTRAKRLASDGMPYDPLKYYLSTGTVQAVVVREGDGTTRSFMHHFGLPVYSREMPILSERKKQQAQPIVDKLNAGEISEAEAIIELDKIW